MICNISKKDAKVVKKIWNFRSNQSIKMDQLFHEVSCILGDRNKTISTIKAYVSNIRISIDNKRSSEMMGYILLHNAMRVLPYFRTPNRYRFREDYKIKNMTMQEARVIRHLRLEKNISLKDMTYALEQEDLFSQYYRFFDLDRQLKSLVRTSMKVLNDFYDPDIKESMREKKEFEPSDITLEMAQKLLDIKKSGCTWRAFSHIASIEYGHLHLGSGNQIYGMELEKICHDILGLKMEDED